MKRLLPLLLVAAPAFAQLLTSTGAGVVVAHDRRIELTGGWSVEGVANATAIVTGRNHVAVLDALRDEVVLVSLSDGRTTRMKSAATPIAGVFLGDELYVLARDARVLQRMGGVQSVALAPDPAFLATWNDRIYVYSRTTGMVEESDGRRVLRRLQSLPFASDFEVAGGSAYLAYPRDARIRTIDLASMKSSGELAVGSVPVDLAFAGGGTALTAKILAVADPSAKRVWLTEGTQSMTEAVARGFLRGLIGLGLFGDRASSFPTGVDRVAVRGKQWVAYDSSSGTLYHFTRKTTRLVARAVPPGGFALTPDGVAWWNGTSVAETPLR